MSNDQNIKIFPYLTSLKKIEQENLNDPPLDGSVHVNGAKGSCCARCEVKVGVDSSLLRALGQALSLTKQPSLLPLVANAVNFLITTSEPWKVFMSLL